MKRRLRLLAVAAVALAVVLAAVVPVVSMLQPGYYRRYADLAQRMDHWQNSTHSRISCAQCHIEPGIGGFSAFAVNAIPAFYSQLGSGPDATNLLKPPSKAACHKCHTGYRSVSPSGDLLIPHRAHVEVLDMQCVTCHKNLVHSLNKRGFNRPEMELCLQCHDGDTASNVCAGCHTRKNAPETHSQPDWLQLHGKAASEECASCHDWTPDYCTQCHEQRPASHVGNWKTGHAASAQTRGDGCLVCHDRKEFCDRCH